MLRALAATLALAALPTGAMAAGDQVSVSLLPGPGVLLEGTPAVSWTEDGAASLDLAGIEVADTSGAGAGWALVAEVETTSGENHLTVAWSSTDAPAAGSIAVTEDATVTLTAGPAL